jgi:hypothetical protein
MINYFKRNGQPDFDLIFGVRKITAADWYPDPTRKNTDVSVPDLSDEDVGYGDDDEARDADADENQRRDEDDDEQERTTKQMTRSQQLSAVAKKYGVVAIAKSVNDKGAFLSETEMTQCIVDHCKWVGQSFEQVFCGSGADAVELRKAVARCRDDAFLKAGTLMPVLPTQTDSLAAARDVDSDAPDAYRQLVAMAEKMRAASPGMTLAQAFERTYSSPEYKALADLERRQAHNRLPTTGSLAPL